MMRTFGLMPCFLVGCALILAACAFQTPATLSYKKSLPPDLVHLTTERIENLRPGMTSDEITQELQLAPAQIQATSADALWIWIEESQDIHQTLAVRFENDRAVAFDAHQE